jgi:hypothetical protein
VATFPDELRKRFVPIRSIGFNTPGVIDGELLTKLALETAGVSYIGVNAQSMFNLLGQTLISILKGNTASIALHRSATHTGLQPGTMHPVIVDQSVKRATFSVQWAPSLVDALELEVHDPKGNLVKPDSQSKTKQAFLQSFDMDEQDLGTWRVRVRPPKDADPNAKVPYTLQAFFVERDLDFRISVDPGEAVTGDPIAIRARVSYGGKPLDKLPAGAIKVRVQRPALGLGTLLHRNRGQSGPNVPGDSNSRYQRRVAAVSKGNLKQLLPSDVETITLVHEKNGVYRA